MVVTGQQEQGDDDPPNTAVRAEAESPAAGAGDVGPDGAASDEVQADRLDGSTEDDSAEADAAAGTSDTPAPPRPALPLRVLLLAAVLNVLLAAGLLTLRPPWRVERADVTPPLPAQVVELQARVARGEHGAPYTLTLHDEELTATARHFLAQSEDVPFSQVRIAVVGERLDATGVTTGLAVAVPVRVVAKVEARDGAPVISVQDVGIGGMALPAFVRQEVLAEANKAVDLSRYDLPVTVYGVTLTDGALYVYGKVR